MLIFHLSFHILQKEIVNGAEAELTSKEIIDDAQKQLESLNKNLTMNTG